MTQRQTHVIISLVMLLLLSACANKVGVRHEDNLPRYSYPAAAVDESES